MFEIRQLYRVAVLAAALVFWVPAWSQSNVEVERTGGPYVPTPQIIVDRMLELGKIGPKDFVIDLGSGDGRIVITAAKRHGAAGFGIEIDPELIERSNATARKEGVEARVAFHNQDMFKADIRKASVLTLYVLPGMMTTLRPKVLEELAPGTRIVSHDYHFGDWLPDERIAFDSVEKQKAVGFSSVNLYLWIVPAHVAGEWRVEAPPVSLKGPVTLRLEQDFQTLRGRATTAAGTFDLVDLSVRGRDVRFAIPANAQRGVQRVVFRGRIDGATMRGEIEAIAGKPASVWSAQRVGPAAGILAK